MSNLRMSYNIPTIRKGFSLEFESNKHELSWLGSIMYYIYLCLCRKHEWEKHGRCATEVKETGSELLYFNKTLSLRMKYDIDE